MSITAETAKEHAHDPAVLCCRAEAGITIEPANLEDPAIFDDLVDSGLLSLDGCLTIEEVLGAKLTKTCDSLCPLTADVLDGVKAPSAPAEEEEEEAAPAAAETAPVKVDIDFSNVEVEPLFEDMVDFETFSKSDFRAVKVKECEAVPKSKKLLKFVLDDGSGEDRVILSGIHDYYEPEELVGKTLIAIVNLPPRKMMGIDSCGMIISATHLVEGREGLNVLIVDDKIPAGAKLY